MANNQRINKFGGPGPRQDRRAQRREEAEHRNIVWRGIALDLRVQMLDVRLGKGVGARRERARLQCEIAGR